ncbi:redoxin domain-containing protein [Chitinophaga sp. SYP-B3965]|uniref:TlpA family protein disulfide reductase n=1 Tax=Chitinophaga sp. SYP-B3965 TaxID=2663120 RepID=UPI001299AC69|nr:TlpA disulfide reductase family protein [Chitinophaga sp. SYP-B3965]MRG48430.1 redoxin domain-containing protein [Chitinophaga sp. SYP-B3965]
MKAIVTCLLIFFSISATAQYAIIKGEIAHLEKDTISIALLHDQVTGDMQIFRVAVNNGKFKTNIYVPRAVYFAVSDDKNYTHGLIQPGDDITLRYDFEDKPGTLQFSGKGAEKSTFYQRFAILKKSRGTDITTAKALENIRSTMNKDSYMLLYAHLTGIQQSTKYFTTGQLSPFNDSLYYSFNYANDVYNIVSEHYRQSYTGKDMVAKYDTLSRILPPKLREPVLTLFIRYDIKQLTDSLVNTILTNNVYREYILKKIAAERKFRKGMIAPDFSLENDKGEKVTLQDYKGKVVHIDFWFEACVPCQQMFERLKPLKAQYAANKDIVFLCVSIDEKGVWKKAKEKIQAEHLYTNNKGRFHPVISDYNIDGYPTTYIIGKDGLIFNEAPSGYPEDLQPQLEAALKK